MTVWPATRSNMPVAGGGFELAPGARVNVSVPDGWIGNWSPRTGCTFDAAGLGHCEVGDCGGRLACDGNANVMPSDHTVVRNQARGVQLAVQRKCATTCLTRRRSLTWTPGAASHIMT